jgi:hypothetical protein
MCPSACTRRLMFLLGDSAILRVTLEAHFWDLRATLTLLFGISFLNAYNFYCTSTSTYTLMACKWAPLLCVVITVRVIAQF